MDILNLIYIIYFVLMGITYFVLMIWCINEKAKFKDSNVLQIQTFFIIWIIFSMIEYFLLSIRFLFIGIDSNIAFSTLNIIIRFSGIAIFSLLFWSIFSYMFQEKNKGVIIGIFSFVLSIGTYIVNSFLIQSIMTSLSISNQQITYLIISGITILFDLLNIILGIIIVIFINSSYPHKNHQEFSYKFNFGIILWMIIYPVINMIITSAIILLSIFTNLLIESNFLIITFFIFRLLIPFIGIVGIIIIQKSILHWAQNKSVEYNSDQDILLNSNFRASSN